MDRVIWVIAHLRSGDAPALVTRVNPNNSVSLTIFTPGEVIHRDNVQPYVYEDGDEDEDKVGFFTGTLQGGGVI